MNNRPYRHLVTLSHYDNSPAQVCSKPCFSQDYYPYKYLNKNYGYNRTNYAPLSDFISTTSNSAFKPIQSSKYSRSHLINNDTSYSDDPCDLEVAQYFRQTSHQWTNPTYYDICEANQVIRSLKKIHTETLC